MYKVSIVIPVYNVEAYIKVSLLSALNQTLDSIEYIIIDDCGADRSIDIVKEIIFEHPRNKDIFIYRHSQNMGLSVARNTGVKMARGKYIFFMDSDDEITEDCIELHYNLIKSSRADYTVANVSLLGAKSNHIKSISDRINHQTPIESYLKREYSVSAWNKLYNVGFLKNNNLVFKENLLHEDILWSYQISLLAEKLFLWKRLLIYIKFVKDLL